MAYTYTLLNLCEIESVDKIALREIDVSVSGFAVGTKDLINLTIDFTTQPPASVLAIIQDRFDVKSKQLQDTLKLLQAVKDAYPLLFNDVIQYHESNYNAMVWAAIFGN